MQSEQALSALIILLLALGVIAVVGEVNRRRRFLMELQRRSGRGPAGPLPFWGDRARGFHTLGVGFPSADEVGHWGLEVAARLRAGAGSTQAWRQMWENLGEGPYLGIEPDGTPVNLEELENWRVTAFTSQETHLARGAVSALTQSARFSQSVGAPLAGVLEVMARGVSQATQALAAQRQAFTGPRLSSYVLTGLPILALFGGELLGANPVGWLVASPVGRVALVLGVGSLAAGYLVSRKLIDSAKGYVEGEIEATLLCDLARSGLSAGVSIPAVLEALGDSQRNPELNRIAKELVMDATWEEAWSDRPAAANLLQRSLQPAWEEGVSPLLLLEHAAQSRRESMVAEAEQAAAKLSVQLVIPLGIFLLPAFILLGILPIVVTMLGGELLP